MSRGAKIMWIVVLLLLMSVLFPVMLVSNTYIDLPFGWKGGATSYSFWMTNLYIKQYLFWLALAFIILTLLVILIIIFYPKRKHIFTLQENNGKLSLDKKAIEGFVQTKLNEREFMETPKVTVSATDKKIKIKVKGKLKRTSSILGKTGALMTEIERELQHILGSNKEKVIVDVAYVSYEKKQHDSNHPRVE